MCHINKCEKGNHIWRQECRIQQKPGNHPPSLLWGGAILRHLLEMKNVSPPSQSCEYFITGPFDGFFIWYNTTLLRKICSDLQRNFRETKLNYYDFIFNIESVLIYTWQNYDKFTGISLKISLFVGFHKLLWVKYKTSSTILMEILFYQSLCNCNKLQDNFVL